MRKRKTAGAQTGSGHQTWETEGGIKIIGEAYTSPEGPTFYLAALSGVRPTKKANRPAIRLFLSARRTYFFSGG
ncbi:hypothetical protein R38712_02048 [Ralstonia pickettii]|jgi:hypothetical protein|uniref:Uncharacterized protein n=1 Tax=Ralstonia pickettii TaxID=329 RepID=A0ABM9ILZ0_RALPI|nr:hypothetical protein R38712_02048 [Ralstonia pickettii]